MTKKVEIAWRNCGHSDGTAGKPSDAENAFRHGGLEARRAYVASYKRGVEERLTRERTG